MLWLVSKTFKASKRYDVRKRWQETRELSLPWRLFKTSIKSDTDKALKLLLPWREMLLFIPSCQVTTLFLSFRSLENRFWTILCVFLCVFLCLDINIGPGSNRFSLYNALFLQGSKFLKHLGFKVFRELAAMMKTMRVFFQQCGLRQIFSNWIFNLSLPCFFQEFLTGIFPNLKSKLTKNGNLSH